MTKPISILDFKSKGWDEYSAMSVKYVSKLQQDNPKKFKEVEAAVRRLGLFGLWKGYYPALYEVAKILEEGEK